MAGRFREMKRQARAAVHREMSVAALYIPAPSATPVPCTVRLWPKIEQQNVSMQGLTGGANMAEPEDRIRFNLSQFSAKLFPQAIVSIEPGEAYRVDHLYDVDLGYQTARVVRLTAAQAAGLPVPA